MHRQTRSLRRLVTLALAIPLLGALQTDAVTLVQEGKPASVIITAESPTDSARQGAEDLQMWLKRASGATVPIQQVGSVQSNPGTAQIFVGDSQGARAAGYRSDELGLEAIRVQTIDGGVVILGDDESDTGLALQGTLFAVHAFAEEALGVRMLWPGELGEIVPQQSTIDVGEVSIRETPRLQRRDMFNHMYNGAIHSKIDALGWDHETIKSMEERSRLWFRFHRIGGSYRGSFGHAFGDYWDRFHEEHPDWFAMQPDGTRDNSQPEHSGYPSQRLCVSNPGLIRQIADDCIERLRKDPQLSAVSVTPNDGGLQTFCLCDTCESWDAPEGKTILMQSKTGDISHVSLTDRYVRFYNAIADLVAEELPGRNIGALAYNAYTNPPIHVKLRPNVVLGFVVGTKMYMNDDSRDAMLENWLQWASQAENLFLYSNSLRALHAVPTNIAPRIGEDLRFYADNRIVFAQYDCNFQHWASCGLNYYVVARLLWDPSRDIDEIIDEFCTVGFGPAASAIHRYYDALDEISRAVAADRRMPDADSLKDHYDDATLARLHAILDEAQQAAGQDETIEARIAFLRLPLEYTPICRDYRIASKVLDDADKWQWRTYFEQSVRRTTWLQKLGPSWAIHTPWLIYQDY